VPYGFDPLILLARGYQQSALGQSCRSPAGAIAPMQPLPVTGTGMGNICQHDASVQAVRQLLDV
jgi:hypothetical protein